MPMGLAVADMFQEVAVVLLTSEGVRAFSTGSDINMLGQYGTPYQLRNRLDYFAC